MATKQAVPSLTRTKQLVAQSLKYGYFQDSSSTRSYFCPLDMEFRRKHHEPGLSHRVSLDYWIARPPKREDIVRRMHEHFREECVHTTDEADR
jgi:hypothetical protein